MKHEERPLHSAHWWNQTHRHRAITDLARNFGYSQITKDTESNRPSNSYCAVPRSRSRWSLSDNTKSTASFHGDRPNFAPISINGIDGPTQSAPGLRGRETKANVWWCSTRIYYVCTYLHNHPSHKAMKRNEKFPSLHRHTYRVGIARSRGISFLFCNRATPYDVAPQRYHNRPAVFVCQSIRNQAPRRPAGHQPMANDAKQRQGLMV